MISRIFWLTILFHADIGISGLDGRRKHSIRGQWTNQGIISSSISDVDKNLLQEHDKSNSLDIGLSLLVGSPIVTEPENEPAKEIETVAVNTSSADPIVVYLLLLFDSTTAKNISWNLREASTNLLVASAPEETYTSQTDAMEVIQLVPGEVYEISFSDSSAVVDNAPQIFTEFVLAISEPAQEITKGQIGSGTTTVLVFAVPDGTNSNEGGEQSPPQEVSIDKNQVSPLEGDSINVVNDLSSVSEAPSSTIATVVDPPDESPPPPEPSGEGLENLCAVKGAACNSDNDCCSSRCSPQKRCFPSGLKSRNRMSIVSGHGGSAADPVSASRLRNGDRY